jgi:hypothetical protein
VGAANQLAADAAALKGLVHRQVRQVGAVSVVGQCPRHTHQQARRIAGRHHQIRLPQHLADDFGIMHRTPLGERGTAEDVDEVNDGQVRFKAVSDRIFH